MFAVCVSCLVSCVLCLFVSCFFSPLPRGITRLRRVIEVHRVENPLASTEPLTSGFRPPVAAGCDVGIINTGNRGGVACASLKFPGTFSRRLFSRGSLTIATYVVNDDLYTGGFFRAIKFSLNEPRLKERSTVYPGMN